MCLNSGSFLGKNQQPTDSKTLFKMLKLMEPRRRLINKEGCLFKNEIKNKYSWKKIKVFAAN